MFRNPLLGALSKSRLAAIFGPAKAAKKTIPDGLDLASMEGRVDQIPELLRTHVNASFEALAGDGFQQGVYRAASGELDYEAYRQAQNIGNRVKLQRVYTHPEVIKAVIKCAKERLGDVRSVLCHGTRNGAEIRWFKERLPADTKVLGTDIADSASEFPDTIQWDFHDFREDWRNFWDVIYTNSWDHAMEPARAFSSWSSSLRTEGLLFLEHGPGHDLADHLDLFAATRSTLIQTVVDVSGGALRPLDPIEVSTPRSGDRTLLPFQKV